MFDMAPMGAMFFVIAVLLFFLVSFARMVMWNVTIPELFGLARLNYWQAFRLLLIATILFGGPAAACG